MNTSTGVNSSGTRKSGGRSRSAVVARPVGLMVLGAVCALMAPWLLPEAFRHLRADLELGPSRGATSRIGTQHPLSSEEDWQEAIAALDRAVEIAPDDGSIQADLGALYGFASLRGGIRPEQRAEYALSAKAHDQLATRLRPTDPRGWAELARAELLTGNAGPSYINAWELAAQLGPGEAMVQNQLIELVFATYPDPYTAAMSDWVRELYITGNEGRQMALVRLAKSFDLSINPDGSVLP